MSVEVLRIETTNHKVLLLRLDTKQLMLEGSLDWIKTDSLEIRAADTKKVSIDWKSFDLLLATHSEYAELADFITPGVCAHVRKRAQLPPAKQTFLVETGLPKIKITIGSDTWETDVLDVKRFQVDCPI